MHGKLHEQAYWIWKSALQLQVILKQELIKQFWKKIWLMKHFLKHTVCLICILMLKVSIHSAAATQEREKLQKHHWEHLFLFNKVPKKSLSIDLQNAYNIVICFLIFLFNSSLSVLICPKFDHQQKTTHILAANPKTDHEKTENKILFWSRGEKNCQKKYLEVKAE